MMEIRVRSFWTVSSAMWRWKRSISSRFSLITSGCSRCSSGTVKNVRNQCQETNAMGFGRTEFEDLEVELVSVRICNVRMDY